MQCRGNPLCNNVQVMYRFHYAYFIPLCVTLPYLSIRFTIIYHLLLQTQGYSEVADIKKLVRGLLSHIFVIS